MQKIPADCLHCVYTTALQTPSGGKFATLNADVIDNFILGWDNGSLGDTRVYVATAGHTWTLSPAGLGVEGFGTSGRNPFGRPPVWNVDLSLFKTFAVGRLRPEFRLEAANVFNHPNWGTAVTGFTANNFTPGSVENATNTPGARRVQLAFRTTF
jgi:hypothetical protein